MKRTFLCLAISAGVALTSFNSNAQPGGRPSAGGFGGPVKSEINAAMMKLFGKATAFSADAEMKIDQANGKPLNMGMKMAVLDGKMRSEIDMASIQGSEMPPQAVAQMKTMGMDKMATIFDPASGKLLMIYPNLKSYAEMPVPKSEAAAAEKKEPKIEKTEMGKETVAGHPTVKNKVKITEEGGKSHEMTVWNATDLKDFPVKMVMNEGGNTVEVLYKNISFNKPESSQFTAPAEFKKYDSFQQMMMENMQKMFGAGVPTGAPRLPAQK